MLEIQGIITHIIFRNEDNGYTVAVLETDDGEITIVGNTVYINVDDPVKVKGHMTYHNTYGEQFSFESIEINTPTTLKGIKSYLSSGLLPGIGPKTAENIVDKFKEDSLDIIQFNPERLLEVKGIGKKTLEGILDAYEDQREIRDIMIFFQDFDISPNNTMKIYRNYGTESIAVIQNNPYRLAEDIKGIGFKRADEIGKQMDIKTDSPFRIRAGIKYILNEATNDGHCFLQKKTLLNQGMELLNVPGELIEKELKNLTVDNQIRIIKNLEAEIYLTNLYSAEENVSGKLLEIAQAKTEDLDIDIEEILAEIELNDHIEFAPMQKEAIKKAISEGLLVITGGPGTGKTTIIKGIIEAAEKLGFEISLAAPTGRAAKRMTETTGIEAKTIHRLLEYSFLEESFMAFNKNEEDPLDVDFLIIDEASMIDINLMDSLLRAINKETRLILVGDIDQLPSVGPGNVLKDIIDSGIIEVVRLTDIFRQSQESMIVVNAHKINNGIYPEYNISDKDFFFMKGYEQEKILETIIALSKTRLPKYYKLDPIRDIQILSPMRNGIVGVNNLNKNLQMALNPKSPIKEEKSFSNSIYREGDKVMQIKNDYEIEYKIYEDGFLLDRGKGVFNGDMGIITVIDNTMEELTVLFDDEKEVIYEFNQLDQLELAYATTIHKAQGSEFKAVIMPISWGPPMLMMRNLLYTGITRAKDLVVLVGDEKYLNMMINNNRIDERNSNLNKRLKDMGKFTNDRII